MSPSNKNLKVTAKHLDRRHFLKAGSLLGLGSLILPRDLFGALSPAQGGDCAPTTDDILGPYYLPGSPNTALRVLCLVTARLVQP